MCLVTTDRASYVDMPFLRGLGKALAPVPHPHRGRAGALS